jgi:RNA recognition motif-containing protein
MLPFDLQPPVESMRFNDRSSTNIFTRLLSFGEQSVYHLKNCSDASFHSNAEFSPVFLLVSSSHNQEGILMPKKLYVGNLAYAVTDQHLNELFSGIGSVTSAAVISDKFSGQSKGFGFLDGTEFMGRNLKVNEAKPRENRSGGGNGGGGGGNSRGGRW